MSSNEATPEITDEQNVNITRRFFDKDNTNWDPQMEYSMLFIRAQEDWMNTMLKNRGHVFLNEVYDALGMERSVFGAVTGWLYEPNSDGVVFDLDINLEKHYIAVAFNVDGIIYDKI